MGSSIVVTALAYLIASATPTLEAAAAALPGVVLTWQFFAGLLIRRQDIPLYLRWYCSLNFLRYGWDAIMVNQFEHVSIPIFGGEEVSGSLTLNGSHKDNQTSEVHVGFSFLRRR